MIIDDEDEKETAENGEATGNGEAAESSDATESSNATETTPTEGDATEGASEE